MGLLGLIDMRNVDQSTPDALDCVSWQQADRSNRRDPLLQSLCSVSFELGSLLELNKGHVFLSTGLETVDQSPDGRVSSEGLESVLLEQGSESTADVVVVVPVDCITTVEIVVALLMTMLSLRYVP